MIELDPEFVRVVAKVATDALIEGTLNIGKVLGSNTSLDLYTCPLTPIEIDIEELDLEKLSSSEAGVFDPLGQLKQFISNLIDSAIGFLSETIGGMIKQFIDWIWNQLSPALSGIASWIEEATKRIIEVGSALTGFINAILKFPEWFPKWFYDNIAKPISDALTGLAKAIWDALPDWLKSAFTGIKDAISSIQGSIKSIVDKLGKIPSAIESLVQSLQNFFKDPLGVLKKAFGYLVDQLWKLLPDWLKGAIKGLQEAWSSFTNFLTEKLTWLWDQIQSFIKDPLGALQGLWEQISQVFSKMFRTFMNYLKGVAKTMIKIGNKIIEAVMKLGTGIVKGLVDVGESISKEISEVFKGLMEGLITPITSHLRSALKGIFSKEGGEIEAILGVGLAIVPSYLTVLLLPKAFKSLAHIVKELRIRIQASLAPLGVGGQIIVNLLTALPHALYELGDALEDLPKKMSEYFILGMSLAGLEPLRYPFRFAWKQYFKGLGLGNIPFELPPLELSRDLIRRLGIEKASKVYRTILEYRGYPDWFVDNFVKLAEDLNIKVTDRFGTERLVPLGLLYAQPSLSMLVDMMLRDIFGAGTKGFEEFTKWAYRLGLYKDVAYLIYLLHFRYPSPTRLWDFISRGIAGMLWYVPPDEEVKVAKEEAKAIGAYEPLPPVKLNFEGKKLFAGLTTYMKWHDYAKFAWMKDFTSDNWMVIDTLADIPTKIDVRWMTKWGIFDFMVTKGVGLSSPVSDFIKVVEDRSANPKVQMDLTLMCRLLQATGLHPYYVPIVSVAETINALADERTLLRTGIINLYEHGAMKYEDLDKLMSELVIASFAVSYFDIEAGQWKSGFINLPVAYLPAERKLLELRAVIDRHLRIFRDTLKDLERAYTEYIIDGADVASKLAKVVSEINKTFKKATLDIVGKEFEIKADKEFIDVVLASWEVARDVYTVRRIRSWVYRVLGWVIYRAAYGWVTEEDAKKVAEVLTDIAKLPKMESEAVKRILTEMVGIATRERVREYVPTPSMLATIAEVIPMARVLATKVFEAKGVPPEWRPIWSQYIDIKPIIDEVKSVISSVKRLYEYFMINEDMFKKFLEVLKPYGYEDRELKLMIDDANLDRWYRAYRELVGTPRELVTMAEYSPLARRLALAEVKKRIDALPIEQEAKEFLYKLWEDYIRIRPVYDEVEREVTELISDYAKGVLTWEQFNELLEELKDWGIDEWEADAVRFIAMMRRRRYELTGRTR